MSLCRHHFENVSQYSAPHHHQVDLVANQLSTENGSNDAKGLWVLLQHSLWKVSLYQALVGRT